MMQRSHTYTAAAPTTTAAPPLASAALLSIGSNSCGGSRHLAGPMPSVSRSSTLNSLRSLQSHAAGGYGGGDRSPQGGSAGRWTNESLGLGYLGEEEGA